MKFVLIAGKKVKMALLHAGVILVLFPAVLTQATDRPTVALAVGSVIGKYESVYRGSDTYRVHTYLGIPFAEPPVDSLRFEKPEPLKVLESNPYDASYYRPICPQMQEFVATPGTEDENCLYLNVFVPEGVADGPDGYAVMVWVHGGGFYTGASNEYHSAYLAATGNVIVVTVNYRLGLFGFFSTSDENAPGNYGLYDQALAFQWVHDNIPSFMGDRNRVTIFGESAGAMSVCFQGLYDKNYGRFQRIIAESGSALIPSVDLTQTRMPGVRLIAEHLNCPVLATKGIVECLREVSWNTLKDAFLELNRNPANTQLIDFTIVLDGDMIKTDPKLLQHELNSYVSDELRFFQSLDFLSGFNQYEGGLFLFIYTGGQSNNLYPTQEDMSTQHIPTTLYRTYGQRFPVEITRVVQHEYTNWSNPSSPESVRLKYVKMLGDVSFIYPAVQSAKYNLNAMKTDRTFMYNFLPVTSQRQVWTPVWLPGADHAEELFSLFSDTFATSWERILSDRMITYWTNFAKSG